MIFVKTLLFTILVPGTVIVWIPVFVIARDRSLDLSSAGLRLLGILPIALGTAAYLLCAWDFASTGRGTPFLLDPPRHMVSKRLYRLARNPMYVGAVLVLLGLAALFQSRALLVYAFIVWLAFHLFVVLYEEPHLEKIFGATYQEYRKAVPRWFPRLGSRRVAA